MDIMLWILGIILVVVVVAKKKGINVLNYIIGEKPRDIQIEQLKKLSAKLDIEVEKQKEIDEIKKKINASKTMLSGKK